MQYTVKSGDTLSGIGAKLGVDWHKITGYRSGNPNVIRPGEVLNIPDSGSGGVTINGVTYPSGFIGPRPNANPSSSSPQPSQPSQPPPAGYDPDRMVNGVPAHAYPGTPEYNDKMAGIDIYAKARGGAPAPTSSNSVSAQSAEDELKKNIINTIIDLDNKLAGLQGVSFTQQEQDNFLNQALELVTPYYTTQKGILEAGVKEGKIRNMEDLAISMRDLQAGLEKTLSGLDISQAKTEEDFVNRLADITSTKEEN